MRRRASTNGLDAGDTGAYVQPQLPTTSVVTPCRIVLSAVGFARTVKSLWLCGSTNPGQSSRPAASIVRRAAAPSRSPTAAIRSPSTPTSPRKPGAPEPSTTSASRIRTSSTGLRLRLRDHRVGDGAETRVEDVAQPVAEEVEAEDGEHDREPREDSHPDVGVDEAAGVGEHVPPGGFRRLGAEAEEAERRLGEDRLREVDGYEDGQRRDDVREDVAPDDPQVARSERARRLDERLTHHLEHRRPDHAGELGREDDPDRHHRVQARRAEEADDEEPEQQVGEGEDHVDEAHQHEVEEAPVEGGEDADHEPGAQADPDRHGADLERDLRAVDDAGERVAPE